MPAAAPVTLIEIISGHVQAMATFMTLNATKPVRMALFKSQLAVEAPERLKTGGTRPRP